MSVRLTEWDRPPLQLQPGPLRFLCRQEAVLETVIWGFDFFFFLYEFKKKKKKLH